MQNQPLKRQIAERDRRIKQLEKQLAGQGQQTGPEDRSLAGTGEPVARQGDESGKDKAAGRPARIVYNGVALPPKNIRPCGKNLQDDEFYLSSAKREADHLVENLGLTAQSRLLDVGSGPGRLAIGILESVGEIREYRGIDVSERSITWGQHYVTPRSPNFQFVHVNAENSRYNPDGIKMDGEFRLPFEDGGFDIICVYSVFSHMLEDEVREYLREFQRILQPQGRIFLTAFLEEGVPDVTENPEGYLSQDWSGPLHCVRYNKDFFEKLLDENGFRLDGFDTSRGKLLQRRVYVSRKS